MKQFFYFSISLLIVILLGCSGVSKKVTINDTLSVEATLLHSECFDESMNNWKKEQMLGGEVFIRDGKMEIDDVSGCTIWFTKELRGSSMIEYDAYIIKSGGTNDRASDLNCFWMAKDPEYPNTLFENSESRGGKFTNYDSLRLYYVGLGGHFNTKTRFRRYTGDGNKPLLPEHDLSATEYLITPNTINHIKIIAHKGIIQYYRNGVLIFDFLDDNPYTSGYFGIRTVNNHMTIDNFKVYKLK